MSLRFQPGDLARVPAGGTYGSWAGVVQVTRPPAWASELEEGEYWVCPIAGGPGFSAHRLVLLTPDEAALAQLSRVDRLGGL